MYLKFYGLREEPFGVTPDPRFLYLTATYREAQATLEYGIRSGRGFTALVARPGMGKTTLLFHLLEQYSQVARTAFIFLTQCDSREFMRYLMSELGADTRETDFVRLQDQFGQLLVREAQAGKKVIAVVDEAQNLDLNVLETVRLLSDFETPRSKLLHIILTGQPELADKLASPSLLQLRQRISHLVRLDPLSDAEVKQFIAHRLRVAGYRGGPLFTPEALSAIAQRSEGIPRTISNLCFNALSLGCALGRRTIDAAIVAEVSADLDFETVSREAEKQPPGVARDREAAAQFHARNDGAAGENPAADRTPSSPEPAPFAEVEVGGQIQEPVVVPAPPGPVLVPDPQRVATIACQEQAGSAEIGNLALQIQPSDSSGMQGVPTPANGVKGSAPAPVNGTTRPPLAPADGSPPADNEKQKPVVDVDALASDCALLGMEGSRRWKPPVNTRASAGTQPAVSAPLPVAPKPNTLRPVPPTTPAPGNGVSARVRKWPVKPAGGVVRQPAATRLPATTTPAALAMRKRRSQRSLYLAAAASGLLLLLLVWLLGASGPSATPSDAATAAAASASSANSQPDTGATTDNSAAAQPSDSTVLDVIEELPQPGEGDLGRDTRPAVVMRGTRKGEQLLRRVDPIYPAAARVNRIQGPVVLEASIGTHGFLRHIRVVNGDPLLAESVLDAVKGWRYQPRMSRGRGVETPTRIVINFQLVSGPRNSAQNH